MHLVSFLNLKFDDHPCFRLDKLRLQTAFKMPLPTLLYISE